jgi:hypothetical protein
MGCCPNDTPRLLVAAFGSALFSGCDAWSPSKVNHHIKNLHGPIHAEIEGQKCTLLTVGHMAHALGRSVRTISRWESMGLFPTAPFVMSPTVQRRLFPAPFVEAVAVIVHDEAVGRRLDQRDWPRFQDAVFEAFKMTVGPLLHLGVAEKTDFHSLDNESGQAMLNSMTATH